MVANCWRCTIGTLYLSLNRKGVDSHKLPGERIRAYSIRDQKIFDIKPTEPVINLAVSSGENPILVGLNSRSHDSCSLGEGWALLKTTEGPFLAPGDSIFRVA